MTSKKKRPGLGHNRPPKEPKERSKDYEKRLRKAGFRRLWVDPATQGLIADLGGKSEALFAHHAEMEQDRREQSEKIEELEANVKQLVELNTTYIEVTSKQAKAKDQQIAELEERGQELAEKNVELEQTAQERADAIADQTATLDKLRNDLEAERNRTLFDRVLSSLRRK